LLQMEREENREAVSTPVFPPNIKVTKTKQSTPEPTKRVGVNVRDGLLERWPHPVCACL
jgi:hypothetical protein